jgi:hypothetical protein
VFSFLLWFRLKTHSNAGGKTHRRKGKERNARRGGLDERHEPSLIGFRTLNQTNRIDDTKLNPRHSLHE